MMEWTKEMPTKPGRYRMRMMDGQAGILVDLLSDGRVVTAANLPYPRGTEMMPSPQWLGPLDADERTR